MRLTKQRHKTGCGPASLAMITGIGYYKALKLMRPDRKPGDCACTDIHSMLKAIEQMGLQCDVSYKKVKISSLKRDAMLIVANVAADGTTHATNHVVVWDSKNKRILDPWAWKSKINMDKKYCQKHLVYHVMLAER